MLDRMPSAQSAEPLLRRSYENERGLPYSLGSLFEGEKEEEGDLAVCSVGERCPTGSMSAKLLSYLLRKVGRTEK